MHNTLPYSLKSSDPIACFELRAILGQSQAVFSSNVFEIEGLRVPFSVTLLLYLTHGIFHSYTTSLTCYSLCLDSHGEI